MFKNLKYLGRWLAIAVAIGVVCCAVAPAAKPVKPVKPATPAYSIVPFYVMTPPEGYQSEASWVYDLNEAGRAVGYETFQKEDGSEESWGLYLDTKTDGCIPVLVPGARYATGINNLNRIVGQRDTLATFWRSPDDAAPVDLPPLKGYLESGAYAINDAGIIVGVSWNPDGSSLGTVWRVVVDENGAVSVDDPVGLLPLEGDPQAWAFALNELDVETFQVTGYSYSEAGLPEAVVWTVAVSGDGTLTPGPAESLAEDYAYSIGYGINMHGDVCGHVESMPFVAPAGQTFQLLPVPRDTYSGIARSINNSGDIVGQVEILSKGAWSGYMSGKAGYYAYLWKDGSAIDLTTQIDPAAGWSRLWTASVINDHGVIGGSGPRDIQWRGFVLIPIEQ